MCLPSIFRWVVTNSSMLSWNCALWEASASSAHAHSSAVADQSSTVAQWRAISLLVIAMNGTHCFWTPAVICLPVDSLCYGRPSLPAIIIPNQRQSDEECQPQLLFSLCFVLITSLLAFKVPSGFCSLPWLYIHLSVASYSIFLFFLCFFFPKVIVLIIRDFRILTLIWLLVAQQ